MKLSLVIAFFIGVIGTIISIAASYISFRYLSLSREIAFEPFLAWPWLMLPLILTSASIAFPCIWHVLGRRSRCDTAEANILYSLLFPPIALMMAYPGREALGGFSHGSSQALYWGACLSQFMVVWLVTRAIETEEKDDTYSPEDY